MINRTNRKISKNNKWKLNKIIRIKRSRKRRSKNKQKMSTKQYKELKLWLKNMKRISTFNKHTVGKKQTNKAYKNLEKC